jgi:hypothetical protein
MAYPVIEPLLGPVNSSNLVFETTVEYRPASVQVFQNGQLKTKLLDDGWVELGGKKIRMKIAPRSGPGWADVMSVYYIPL